MATDYQKSSALEVSKPTDDAYEMHPHSKLRGTNNDDHDMRILGRVQQLNVGEQRPCANRGDSGLTFTSPS